MRLLPKSDEEPDKIGTVARVTMRCGHSQSYYVALQVSEEHLDIEAWTPEYRARFEEDLRDQLERARQTRECEACESCEGMPMAEVLAEIEQAKIIQHAAQQEQVRARDAHAKARIACEAIHFRLEALQRRLEAVRGNG